MLSHSEVSRALQEAKRKRKEAEWKGGEVNQRRRELEARLRLRG